MINALMTQDWLTILCGMKRREGHRASKGWGSEEGIHSPSFAFLFSFPFQADAFLPKVGQ
jgi:hypothetical protein